MSRRTTKQPLGLVGIILLLGSTSIALGTSIALPGLADFDWAQEARAGRELIQWFAQVSGAGSDFLPIGILFILPVFAARWLLLRLADKDKLEKALEEYARKPSLIRDAMAMGAELVIVVAVSAVLGGMLALYLAGFVVPRTALGPSFVIDTTAAVVLASALYFVMIRIIDRLGLVDGAAVLTFCGAAATFGKAIASVLPFDEPAGGDMDLALARALLASAAAIPIVIVLLMAQRRFEVTVSTRRKKISTSTMPFALLPPNTLRLAVGFFLWTATAAMIAAAAIGHTDIEGLHALDWLLFPVQPVLISFVFYWLATSNLSYETYHIARLLRLSNTYLPRLRPGRETEEFLKFAFRRMLAAAAVFAGAISALVAFVFWLSGSTALQSLQGLAWIWTIGASAAALLRGIESRTDRTAPVTSLVPRLRWTPARAQFTLLCVTALIDRVLAAEEEFEALALGARTRTLHETEQAVLKSWLFDIEARKNDHAALIALADLAIADYPADMDMRRAIYAQCADIAHADRTVNAREHNFLRYLAKNLRLPQPDRDRIESVVRAKNRH